MRKRIAKFRVGQVVQVQHHSLKGWDTCRITECAEDSDGQFVYSVKGQNWFTSVDERRLKTYDPNDTWRTVVQCDFAETTPSTPKGGGSKILKLSCGHTVRRKRSVPTPKKVDCPQCRLKRR